MVTSSGDDLPRDIEFLYSKKPFERCRVACADIGVHHRKPRLLEVQCNTVEQLKLVNTLCWARRYAA